MINIELEDYDSLVNRDQRRCIFGALGVVMAVIVLAVALGLTIFSCAVI